MSLLGEGVSLPSQKSSVLSSAWASVAILSNAVSVPDPLDAVEIFLLLSSAFSRSWALFDGVGVWGVGVVPLGASTTDSALFSTSTCTGVLSPVALWDWSALALLAGGDGSRPALGDCLAGDRWGLSSGRSSYSWISGTGDAITTWGSSSSTSADTTRSSSSNSKSSTEAVSTTYSLMPSNQASLMSALRASITRGKLVCVWGSMWLNVILRGLSVSTILVSGSLMMSFRTKMERSSDILLTFVMSTRALKRKR